MHGLSQRYIAPQAAEQSIRTLRKSLSRPMSPLTKTSFPGGWTGAEKERFRCVGDRKMKTEMWSSLDWRLNLK